MRMRKTFMTLAGASLLALSFGSLSSPASAAPATQINDFGCFLIAADGPYGAAVFTNDSHAVNTNNARNNAVPPT